MCAINGYLRIPTHKDLELIERMNESNSFRGPDGTSYWFDDRICLGHNLLSISGDPETSMQPVKSKKGNYLVYNGENFDHNAYDTDHLCDMLDYYGISYLKNINAHFALAWYEPDKNQVTLARDHYGVKPLFYYTRMGQLAFSSSIHGINAYETVCIDYMKQIEIERTAGYHIGNMTVYKDVYSLNMGEYITFNVLTAGVISSGSLHDYTLEPQKKTDKEIKDLIYESIESVANTNKQTALSVSGGLDSTTLATVLSEKNMMPDLITMNYEGANNNYTSDWSYAREFYRVNNFKYNLVTVTQHKARQYEYNTLLSHKMLLQDYDRQICRHMICQKASELGAKVLLMGDGADEIFTGYSGHNKLYSLADNEKKSFFEKEFDQWKEDTHGNFPKHVFGPDHINNFLYLDLFRKCNTYNIGTDAHAGFYGIESRLPFLRQKLVKTMMCVPSEDKLRIIEGLDLKNLGNTKYYLRHLFKNQLPEMIINRKIKSGFSLPWNSLSVDYNRKRRQAMFRNLRKMTENHS